MPRKKINVNPFHYIEIPIKREDWNLDGSSVYYNTDNTTFDYILNQIKKLGIPESEYENITCRIENEGYGESPYFSFLYIKPKTKKEIQKETIVQRKEIEEYNIKREQKQREIEKKKLEKQKILSSLTVEQKKALGIK